MSTQPRLTRQSPRPPAGIVHLGPGAFFKAFNAVYTDAVLTHEDEDWGIIAVSLQSDQAARALNPQDCVYTAVSLAPDGRETAIVKAISDVLVAREDPKAVLDKMADPKIRIVSLTVTEKGYFYDPTTGGLRVDAPEIKADLAHPEQPQTAPGFIVEALAQRRAAGVGAFTVLSCDNLPSNGAVVRRVVLDLAEARDPSLAAWIADAVRFPSTMVDRITPATTDEDIARLAEVEGYHDPACVVHEPFRQWVIEDDFVAGRPAWDRAGAQFVRSVAAHETMKLRCLNGTHSALAYLGYLAGYETVSETVADPVFSALCEALWSTEILPTLAQPEGEDLNAYTVSLLRRYANPGIRHRTWQIAMDGSQKLPQRILDTVRAHRHLDAIPGGLCLAVAAWMRFVGGTDEHGNYIDVRDPLAAKLKALSNGAGTGAEKVAALMTVKDIFGPDLRTDAAFREAVTQAYDALVQKGARAAVRDYVSALA